MAEARICQAIVGSTGKPCIYLAKPRSKYCGVHKNFRPGRAKTASKSRKPSRSPSSSRSRSPSSSRSRSPSPVKSKKITKKTKSSRRSKTSMAGQKICFSGFRDSELEERIEALGGRVTTAVSGQTNALVMKEKGTGSAKEVKADELGIPVFTKENFIELFLS